MILEALKAILYVEKKAMALAITEIQLTKHIDRFTPHQIPEKGLKIESPYRTSLI